MYSRDVVKSGSNSKPHGAKKPSTDQHLFSKTASRTHVINVNRAPMRGGIRL